MVARDGEMGGMKMDSRPTLNDRVAEQILIMLLSLPMMYVNKFLYITGKAS